MNIQGQATPANGFMLRSSDLWQLVKRVAGGLLLTASVAGIASGQTEWSARTAAAKPVASRPANTGIREVGSHTASTGSLQWRAPNQGEQTAAAVTKAVNPPQTLRRVAGEVELNAPPAAPAFQVPAFDTPVVNTAGESAPEISVLESVDPVVGGPTPSFGSPVEGVELSPPHVAQSPDRESEPGVISEIFGSPIPQSGDANPPTVQVDDDRSIPTPSFDPSARPTLDPTRNFTPEALKRAMEAEATTCDEFLRKIRQTSLEDICLDITPIYKPQAGSPQINCRQSNAKLIRELNSRKSVLESRVWRDWQGAELATGVFDDYDGGRVYVNEANGSSAAIRYNQLSAADQSYLQRIWELPGECVLEGGVHPGRPWLASTFTWKASAVCHKPLYFEDFKLERYGHSRHPLVQPVASGAHFFGSILVLPYKMGIHPPNECVYDLGYYRPGNCAPYLRDPIPISARGAAYMAGAYVGGAFLIP